MTVTSAFDLNDEIHGLEQRPEAVNSKTLWKTDDLRIVLIVLKQGGKLHEHHADARISVHVLRGAVRFTVGDETLKLQAGSIMPLEASVAHSVEALEASALLLTMAWPSPQALRSMPHRGYK